MLTHFITVGQVLDAPGGRAVLERFLPQAVDRADVRELLILFFLRVTPGLRDDEQARAAFWAEIDALMSPIILREHAAAITPSPVDVGAARSSARWRRRAAGE